MFKYTLLLATVLVGSTIVAEESLLQKAGTNIKQGFKWLVPTYLASQHLTAHDIIKHHRLENHHYDTINRFKFFHTNVLPKRGGLALIPCAAAWLYDSINTIRQYKIVRKAQ